MKKNVKRLSILLSLLILGIGAFGQTVHFSKEEQGVRILKGAGTPTVTVGVPKGSIYTDTVTGLAWNFTQSEWSVGVFGNTEGRANLGVMSTHNTVGGFMSGVGVATFTVTAGEGYIVTGFEPEPIVVKVTYDANVSVTPLFQSNDIFINPSGVLIILDGSLGLQAADIRDNLFLGRISFDAGLIVAIQNTPSISVGIDFRFETFLRCVGGLTCSGNLVSVNADNLQLKRDLGTTLRIASNLQVDKTVPDLTFDSQEDSIFGGFTKILISYESSTPGVFTFDLYTGVEPDSWDDGTGTKGVVSNNKWTVQRLYFFNGNETYLLQLGQVEYMDFAAAISGIRGEQFLVDQNTKTANLICSIVVKKGETNLNSAEAELRQADRFGHP